MLTGCWSIHTIIHVSVVLVGSYQTFMSMKWCSVLRTVLYWQYIIHTPGGHFVLFENGSFKLIFYHLIAVYCWEVQFYDSNESFMADGCHLDSKTSKWFVYIFKKVNLLVLNWWQAGEKRENPLFFKYVYQIQQKPTLFIV